MRRLIYSMQTSLDGYVEDSSGEFGWAAPNEEVHQLANDLVRDCGAMLYGRRMYELMAAHWPTADQQPEVEEVEADFARVWRATPKIVYSRTLSSVDHNSELVAGDVVEHVRSLKDGDGADLLIGGPTVAADVVRAGLVDEYQMTLYPVRVGGGKPFFPDGGPQEDLRLVAVRSFNDGAVMVRYERA